MVYLRSRALTSICHILPWSLNLNVIQCLKNDRKGARVLTTSVSCHYVGGNINRHMKHSQPKFHKVTRVSRKEQLIKVAKWVRGQAPHRICRFPR
ncbi:Eukaryotic translation initiation factor 3 subunit D [Fusarium oxysporum f. sp. albedinis]|nr:Eukaryotic translation initiation factor 3 subunit D [Fusarium oxysporum f. sp. albedinis]